MLHADPHRAVSVTPQRSALKKSLLLHVAVLGLILLLPYLHVPPKPVEPSVVEAVLVSPRAMSPQPTAALRPEPAPAPKPAPEPDPVATPKPAETPSVTKDIPKVTLPKQETPDKKPAQEKPVAKPEPAKPLPPKPLTKPSPLNSSALNDEIAALTRASQQAELDQIQKEAAASAAAARATANLAIRDKYQRLINQRVVTKWNRPLTARNGMVATLRITVLPGGEVSNVVTLKSSGDAAFDASAEEAVRKSSPLPVPSDATVFNQYFRVITLKFNPEDL